ncbi:MAG TPA: hypothetical protein VE261_04140, partial [Gaiellaceae bacterium]|nr:hypothetical protein [Gaiellaceae bacterium]
FWLLAARGAAVALFGISGNAAVAMAASFLMSALSTIGLVVWATLIQQRVHGGLLGRVNSIDWLVSTSLMPLALVAIGPIADTVGPQPLLEAAGAGAALLTLGFLLVPGVLASERGQGWVPRDAREGG